MKKATLCLYKNDKLYKKYENINIITNKDRHSLIIDDIKTIISNNKIIRENEEYRFELDVVKKTAIYILKEKNAKFDIEVEDIIMNNNKEKIVVEYKISSDEEKTKIELILNGE